MINLNEIIIGVTEGCLLDENNIVWKQTEKGLIGKRSVWTFDFRACWIEETVISNVKSWWCGIDSDYTEIFN